MSKQMPVRQLDEFELLFTRIGNYGPDSAEYAGVINELALSSAYSALCAKHPVLSGCIRRNTRGYELAVPGEHVGQIVTLDGGVDELRSKMLSYRVHSDYYECSRLIHTRGVGGGIVTLAVNHAVVDGSALFAYVNELWEMYTAISTGNKIQIECSQNLPRSFAELWQERWHKSKRNLDRGTYVEQLEQRECNDHGIYLERVVSLNEDETASLISSAKRHNVSVHGVVCAAILVALRSLSNSTTPEKMEIHSAVNLRDRVAKSVGRTETTNFAGFHVAGIEIEPADDILRLAAELNKQFKSALSRGEIMSIRENRQFFESSIGEHLSPVTVSNIGVLTELKTPPGIEIVDRIKFAFGGDKAPSARPVYGVLTCGGRLKILGDYPSAYFSDSDAQAVSDRIEHDLHMWDS